MITVLKSKLKKVYITSSESECEGSLSLCPCLMRAAGLIEYERVEVNSVKGWSRIVTYVIKGKCGEVGIRGGAAKYFDIGEAVHVNCFQEIDDERVELGEKEWKPLIVTTDENNNIIGDCCLHDSDCKT